MSSDLRRGWAGRPDDRQRFGQGHEFAAVGGEGIDRGDHVGMALVVVVEGQHAVGREQRQAWAMSDSTEARASGRRR
jgi:hypothetical protein